MTNMTRPCGALAAILLAASSATGCAASSRTAQPVCPLAAAPAVDARPADGLEKLDDEQLVRTLLEVSSASAMGKQIAGSMLDTFRKMPNLPAGFIERFKQNMKPETLIEIIVPIYLKHYDRRTLIETIRFYRTEAGRKLLAAMPTATAETMEAGKAWGVELAKKTMKDLGAP